MNIAIFRWCEEPQWRGLVSLLSLMIFYQLYSVSQFTINNNSALLKWTERKPFSRSCYCASMQGPCLLRLVISYLCGMRHLQASFPGPPPHSRQKAFLFITSMSIYYFQLTNIFPTSRHLHHLYIRIPGLRLPQTCLRRLRIWRHGNCIDVRNAT